MSDLSPEDRALLRAGGRDDAPTTADHERVRRRLAARLGVAIVPGAVGAATKTTAAAASVSLATKLVTALVVLGAVGGGAALWASRTESRRAPAPAMVTIAPSSATPAVAAPTPLPTATLTATATVVDAPVETPSTNTAPAATVPPSLGRPAPFRRPPRHDPAEEGDQTRVGIAASASPASAASGTPNDVGPSHGIAAPPGNSDALAAETQMLREANAATRAGDAARALGLLDEHAKRFPRGVLAEERDAERVLALCAAGRASDAHAAAARFLAERPRSPLAGRVRASCGAP